MARVAASGREHLESGLRKVDVDRSDPLVLVSDDHVLRVGRHQGAPDRPAPPVVGPDDELLADP